MGKHIIMPNAFIVDTTSNSSHIHYICINIHSNAISQAAKIINGDLLKR
jgi:hypothetical protein